MDRTKIYHGYSDTRKVFVASKKQDGRLLRHVERHSPDGFMWGYGGSGPADLALSILCDLFEEQPTKQEISWGKAKAMQHYQKFKWVFIAPLDIDSDFAIKAVDIIEWLEERYKQKEEMLKDAES